jgi:hypothetical protein
VKFHPPKVLKNKPCERCLAPRRVVGKLCGFCHASDVRRFEEQSRKSRIVVKDAFGSIRTGQGKGILKRALPIGTTVIRKHNNVEARFIKVSLTGLPQRRWMNYARWWWEKNRGPVPPGQLVIHIDGNSLNDDPKNYMVGTPGMKLALAHRRDPQWSKDQHKRAAAGLAEVNRKRGRINRAQNFLKTYWYPVVDDLGVILNVPFRKRKRVLACFGVDVSRYPRNGRGKKVTSEVQRALKATRIRPVKSEELPLRRYGTYCLIDPVSRDCRGPMSMGVPQLVTHLGRMGIWAPAEKYAKKDLRERK